MSNNVSAKSQAAQSVNPTNSVAGTIVRLQQAFQSIATYFDKGHLRVYAHIGEILAFILDVKSDKAKYADFIDERDRLRVPAAPLTANQYLPFVRLTDGKYQEADGKPAVAGSTTAVWVPNRSSEKYAIVLDYLISKGVDPKDVVKHIDGYKDAQGRTKISGIIAAMQEKRRNSRTPTALTWKTGEKESIRKLVSICEVPINPADIPTHDGFAIAFLSVEEGKMMLKKIPPGSANDVIKFARAKVIGEAKATSSPKGYRTGNGVSVDLQASREAAEQEA